MTLNIRKFELQVLFKKIAKIRNVEKLNTIPLPLETMKLSTKTQEEISWHQRLKNFKNYKNFQNLKQNVKISINLRVYLLSTKT